MRFINDKEVDLTEYEDFADALRQFGRFLDELTTGSGSTRPWGT